MVAFNFKPEFADAIRAGAKVQTIRQTRRCAVGNTMHLFTGQRTRQCVKLAERPCVVVDCVHLTPDGITLGNVKKHPRCWDEFAALDGFSSYEALLAFFVKQYGSDRFTGTVHRWAAA